MDTATISLIVAVLAFLLAIAAFLKKPAQNKPVRKVRKDSLGDSFGVVPQGLQGAVPLKLQAYERLVLLAERIALPNLISRLNQPGISAWEMKIMLTENIKAEFEYNSSQQLYVSPVSWDAVRNLKEQNIMIINQVAAMLPADASAPDLNRKILEVIMSQPNGSLHELVLQALNFEAKKLMA